MIQFYGSSIGKEMLENRDFIFNRLRDFIEEEFSNWITKTLEDFKKINQHIYNEGKYW